MLRHAPPEVTPSLQHLRVNVREPIGFDHEFFVCHATLRHAWLRTVCELMCIRIARLEEGGEGACVSFVDQGIILLDGVHAVPVDRVGAWEALASTSGRQRVT